ncbi:MAG: DJ-1/PfpI family protein [Candidatus Omnitrophica bacterium]|nr:DJ-1/PfpI family protein [Candidatus Omnitrophota bacterium]
MKKAVMVVAQNGFRDEELLEPKKVLEDGGIKVIIASRSTKPAKGMLGAVVKPDISLEQISVNEFDAVIFVGGSGSSEYWDNSQAHKIAQEAMAQGKVLAAICIAPVTLAKAGLLRGKKATVWASEAGQLKAYGAFYTANAVEQDGKIVTANGPSAAREFGETIAKMLK